MGVRKQVNDSVHKAMMNVKISLPEMNNKLRELAQLMVEANTHMDTATTVGVIAERKRYLSCGGNPISGSRTNSDDQLLICSMQWASGKMNTITNTLKKVI